MSPPRAGYYRVLGCWGDREDDMPEGKKHELWLPVPGKDVKPVDIEAAAIERFHDLADERTEESVKGTGPLLPFHPLDTKRNNGPAKLGERFRLKPGDLVYFNVKEAAGKVVVSEVALAAIWRGRVEDATGKAAGAHEFFAAVDPDLVPFQPGRQRVTIAEQMFGFVEEDLAEKSELALPSRIRFTDATLVDAAQRRDQVLEPEGVTLRILSSPKPPSPALYCKPGTGSSAWIGKSRLKPGTHHPQGRKVYLHQFSEPGQRPWATGDATESKEQKNFVHPVKRGISFEFKVRYDNLTDAELGLLLYGLAPAAEFHHKLGMGKPLGLGSVKIEVAGVQAVDRAKRYTLEGLRGDRAAAVPNWTVMRDAVVKSGLVSESIHKGVCLLGTMNEEVTAKQVHAPTVAGQAGSEGETFKWFVGNDGILPDRDADLEIRERREWLRPLSESRGKLPTLPQFEWRPGQRR